MTPLQFITHTNERVSYMEGAQAALRGGCKWIQLRMKDASDTEFAETARQLLPHCRQLGGTLILDDRALLVREVGAQGVHLGKNDMPVAEARKLLPKGEYIIGGTANTIEDIRRLVAEGVDYIGCGPFRFAHTKNRLAPIIGVDGYKKIIDTMRRERIDIPLVAIGGITLADIKTLRQVGVQAVAISGAILQAENPTAETRRFMAALDGNVNHQTAINND